MEHSALHESCASPEAREKEKASEAFHQEELLGNEKNKLNTSELAFKTSNGDDLEDKGNALPSTVNVPNTNDTSRSVGQFSSSCEEAKSLLTSGCRDSIVLTENSSDIYNKSQSTLVDVLKANKTLRKTIIFRKLSRPSPSHSSQHSDVSNKTLYVASTLPLPPMSSHAPTKENASEFNPGNQVVTGASVPHSQATLAPLHGSGIMALQPGSVASSSCVQSGEATNQMKILSIQKRASPIDYQLPVLANPPVEIPPALSTSYANLSSTLAPNSPVVSSLTKKMETVFRLSSGSAQCPVTRLVRVVASQPVSVNYTNTNSTKLREQKEDNLESSLDNDNAEEGSNMLKKVMLGSKGSFYFRPTSALKNAISEMRKMKINEAKAKEESSSGFLTLPDGNPIPHPIFIPPRKSEVQVIKHKKKIKKKRYKKKIKDLLEEKVRESLECSKKNEIPKMMVVFARGSFHVCQIDVIEDR